MKKSRTGYVIKNSWYGFFNKIISIASSFIVRTVFIKELGVEYLGVDGLFSNILVVLSLAELGVGNVLTYSLYLPVAEGDGKKVSQLLDYYKKMYRYIAIAVTCIGVAFIPFLNLIVKSSFSSTDILKFYVIYLLNSVVSYFSVRYVTLIKAEQQQYLMEIVAAITKVIMSVAQIIVLITTHNFILYLFMLVVYTISQNVIASIIAKRRYRIVNYEKEIDSVEKSNIKKNVKATFLYKVGVVIVNYTDNILISVLLSTIYVGYYSNYSLIVGQINGLIGIICTALISSIGNLSAENDINKSNTVFKRLVFIFHLLTLVCAADFIVLFDDFITLWIGNDNTLGIFAVLAITFSFYIQNIINPVWMYREAYGLFDKIKYLMLSTAALNIIFSLVLGIKFGVAGIIGATGIARLLSTAWYEPKVLYDNIFKRSAAEYFKLQGKYLLQSTSIIVCAYLIGRIMPLNSNIILLGFKAIIISLFVGLSFSLFNYRSNEMVYWKMLAKSAFNKKK